MGCLVELWQFIAAGKSRIELSIRCKRSDLRQPENLSPRIDRAEEVRRAEFRNLQVPLQRVPTGIDLCRRELLCGLKSVGSGVQGCARLADLVKL
ncbi:MULTISPECIES: hypothetical protein [unclassified Bradyrhizobium]|uniref:hypothetical protein n=1 Tax=unclassified Bradyrhizobium TaxID=2631580 RepID=UPI0020B2FD3F|nr:MULTISPECIES: hypothetical protein [unclassified Bradyrhizobium]MCP3379992.1 hypothetical protein [Bradyrhizobium sp. CCGUVB4N]MCP3440831.1 hypothetical protein [Bradyrhizobium sp. CCGUVB14]